MNDRTIYHFQDSPLEVSKELEETGRENAAPTEEEKGRTVQDRSQATSLPVEEQGSEEVKAMASGRDEQIEKEKQTMDSPAQEQPSVEKEKCPQLPDSTFGGQEGPAESPEELINKDSTGLHDGGKAGNQEKESNIMTAMKAPLIGEGASEAQSSTDEKPPKSIKDEGKDSLKNEQKKVEETEGTDLIKNEKTDGLPKDDISELSVEEQVYQKNVKTVELLEDQTAVEAAKVEVAKTIAVHNVITSVDPVNAANGEPTKLDQIKATESSINQMHSTEDEDAPEPQTHEISKQIDTNVIGLPEGQDEKRVAESKALASITSVSDKIFTGAEGEDTKPREIKEPESHMDDKSLQVDTSNIVMPKGKPPAQDDPSNITSMAVHMVKETKNEADDKEVKSQNEEEPRQHVIKEAETSGPSQITSMVGHMVTTAEKEDKKLEEVKDKEPKMETSDSQEAELSKETDSEALSQKKEEPRQQGTKEVETKDPALITSLVGHMVMATKKEDTKEEEVKDKDLQLEGKQDTTASDSQKAELNKEVETGKTNLQTEEEPIQQEGNEAKTGDPALTTSLVEHIATTADKKDNNLEEVKDTDSKTEVLEGTVASDLQQAELSKETDTSEAISQSKEEPRDQRTKEAETNDPPLITSLVGHIVTTMKEEEKTQDEVKAKDSQIEVKPDTVASNSQKAELGKETTILQKEEEPRLQGTKEAETNDPALITSLVGHIVATKMEDKNLAEVKATDSQLEVKQDTVASDSQKAELRKETDICETKSQKGEDPGQQGRTKAETSDPAQFKTVVGLEDTASEWQRESLRQEIKELSQEDQSKRDEPKIAASDVPLQSKDDIEVEEVKKGIDDPPAGISNEKSKNASEQKVKANATSSCQLL